MVLGGVWGCTVSWMVLARPLGDHVFPEFFTPAFTANVLGVERYTASPPPTTPLQSSTAFTALYSDVYYTAIQPIQYTALYNHPLI